MNFHYIYLSSQFYKDYPTSKFPEISYKPNRPHIMFWVKIEGVDFAIPFRSKISHPYAFLTSQKEKKGIDYSKAILISNPEYIINTSINRKEHNVIARNKRTIFNEFSKYVRDYKIALNMNARISKYKFSTLQYFKKELTSKLTSQPKQIPSDNKNSDRRKNKFSL